MSEPSEKAVALMAEYSEIDLAEMLADAGEEISFLHDGEESGYDPAVVPTPGQFMKHLHTLNPERRIELLGLLMEASRQFRLPDNRARRILCGHTWTDHGRRFQCIEIIGPDGLHANGARPEDHYAYLAKETEFCGGCNHAVHVADFCEVVTYGGKCPCDEGYPAGGVVEFPHFGDRGEAERRKAGIDGTAGDAQGVRHRAVLEAETGCCVLCGLSHGHKMHIDRPPSCGFCYEEQGEEIHPHPECPVRTP